jgi:predicted ABC-type ATPase
MFAGPNGSGKSTIKSLLRPELLGFYVNPDELQKQLESPTGLDFGQFDLTPGLDDLRTFFASSSLIKQAKLGHIAAELLLEDKCLIFPVLEKAAYLASVSADFIRQHLVAANASFTFETVMSSPDKIELLRQARLRGFRTYLYYIATEDVEINVSRIRTRVASGGHNVPTDKIISRYARSLDLLLDAIRLCDRAYIFDNSGPERFWLAEISEGQQLRFVSNTIPAWFQKAVLDKLR